MLFSYFNVLRHLLCESLHVWKFFPVITDRIRVKVLYFFMYLLKAAEEEMNLT
jgi:hypothetical protein